MGKDKYTDMDYKRFINNEVADIENITDSDIPEDSELLKMRLIEKLTDRMFIDYEKADKQISRLNAKEIVFHSIMEATDDMLNFSFYRPYSQNYRTLKISLLGMSRKENIELVKSVAYQGEAYMDDNRPEKRGLLSRLFRREF